MTIEPRKVTWYSQIAAIVLGLAIFVVGFSLGKAYGQAAVVPGIDAGYMGQ
jgi:hypothetical protein